MAGYVIHLAVAKEYLRNFRIKDEKEFLKGTIAPDLLSKDNKKTTHYSEQGGSGVRLKEFLKHNSINTAYMKGYFLHLVVDYLFYNNYFPNTINETGQYNDYDILNKEIIEKYNIEIPEDIKEVVQFKTGELQLLDREKVNQMIEEISRKPISEYKKEALKTEKVTVNLDDNEIVTMEENKKDKFKLAIAIIAMCFVMLFFINQKQGFHCDEIFSYGSSNSAYENVFWSYREKTPMHKFLEAKIFQDGNLFDWIKRVKYYFIDNVNEKDEFITEKIAEEKMIWRTREEAIDYLKAKDNKFNYASVYYNQVQDVHPPLFYMLVHTVSSIFNNTFSKYIIFFVNLPFFIGTCILIWKILNLIGRKSIALLSVLLYGLSIGGISTVMFQRMYMMLTFFTIAFLYLNLHIVKNEYKLNKKTRIFLIGTAILGFLTQYFFAVYAAIVAIVMVVLFIKNKEYKEMRKYIGTLIFSAIMGLMLFPFSINHMLFSDRKIGGFQSTNYFDRVLTYFNMILRYFGSKWEIMLALFAIALLALLIRREPEKGVTVLIILPTIIYIMLIAKLAEFLELRYVMNILPIVAIMIMIAVGSIFENKKYNTMIASVAFLLLIGYGFLTEKPLYLYEDYTKYIEISQKYADDDLVYVGYTFFNHIQSLPEFTNYKKTFMIYNDQTDELINNEELLDKSEFILSVNRYMEPEKVLEEVLKNTGFNRYELLYEGDNDVCQIIYRIYR